MRMLLSAWILLQLILEWYTNMKTIVDKPNAPQFKAFDCMCTELSPHMNDYEIDKVVGFMNTVSTSKYDINPTVEDSKTQLRLLLGTDRYQEVVWEWKKKNQKLLSSFGTLKYKSKIDPNDKTLYDGLSPEDKPDDYDKIYV